MEKAGDYPEAAQLALQAGFPNAAKSFVDQGYAKKLLDQGADASRDQRLKDLVTQKLAEDKATLAEGEKIAAKQPSSQAAKQPSGDAPVATGFNRPIRVSP